MKVVTVSKKPGVWDSKYVIILHPPLTGHVGHVRIANFAIFDWNLRLSETVRDRTMVHIER